MASKLTTAFMLLQQLMRPLTRSGRLVAAVEGLLYEVHGRCAPQVLLFWGIQPSLVGYLLIGLVSWSYGSSEDCN